MKGLFSSEEIFVDLGLAVTATSGEDRLTIGKRGAVRLVRFAEQAAGACVLRATSFVIHAHHLP
jgi:hypothetical protein